MKKVLIGVCLLSLSTAVFAATGSTGSSNNAGGEGQQGRDHYAQNDTPAPNAHAVKGLVHKKPQAGGPQAEDAKKSGL